MKTFFLLSTLSISLFASHFISAGTKDMLLNDCKDAFKTKYGEGSIVTLKRTKTYKGLTTMTFKVVPEGGGRTKMTCSSRSGEDLVIE